MSGLHKRFVIQTPDADTAHRAQCAMGNRELFHLDGQWLRVLRVTAHQDVRTEDPFGVPVRIRQGLIFMISVEEAAPFLETPDCSMQPA